MNQPSESALYLSPFKLADLAEIFSEIEFSIHLLICKAPHFQQEYISIETGTASKRLKHLLNNNKATIKEILNTVHGLGHISEFHFISDELSVKSVTILVDNALISFLTSNSKELYLSKLITCWGKNNNYPYMELNGLKSGILYKPSESGFIELYSTDNLNILIHNIIEIENKTLKDEDFHHFYIK